MRRHSGFFLICLLLLCTLKWWSENISKPSDFRENAQKEAALESPDWIHSRQELLETLDHLVTHENYYRSVFGRYTPHIGRIGYSIPSRVSQSFEIRILEASESRLLITAFSESMGRRGDLASIDQSYQFEANFPTPLPRPAYLRLLAEKQLRLLRDQPAGVPLEEQGIYKGYFRYEGANESRIGLAVGIKAPVQGMQIELGPDSPELTEADFGGNPPWIPGLSGTSALGGEALGETSPLSSRRDEGGAMSPQEEVFLAQRIFRGEVGRYARSWAELSEQTNFDFEEQKIATSAVPHSAHASSAGAVRETELPEGSRGVATATDTSGKLEIEPLGN